MHTVLLHDLKTKILLVKMTQYEIIILLFHEKTVCERKSKMIDPKSKNLKYRWSYVCPFLNNPRFFRLFLLLHFVIRHHVFTQNLSAEINCHTGNVHLLLRHIAADDDSDYG